MRRGSVRRARREPRDDRGNGPRRRGPDEEYSPDTFERRVERLRYGEVTGDDLDARGQRGAFRPAREGADGHPSAQKLVDYEAPDAAGGACHENRTRPRQ